MNQNATSGLSSQEQALVDLFRAETEIDDARETALAASLETVVLGGGVAAGAGAAGGGSKVVPFVIGAVSLSGVLALAWGLSQPPRDPETRTEAAAVASAPSNDEAAVSEPPAPEVAEAPEMPPEEPPALAPAPPPPAKMRPARRRAPRAQPEPTASAKNGVREELALMAKIRKALSKGRDAQALGLLRVHRQQFPHGVFADERDVSIAEAHCHLADGKGRALAQAFIAARPSSPLVGRVRRACLDD